MRPRILSCCPSINTLDWSYHVWFRYRKQRVLFVEFSSLLGILISIVLSPLCPVVSFLCNRNHNTSSNLNDFVGLTFGWSSALLHLQHGSHKLGLVQFTGLRPLYFHISCIHRELHAGLLCIVFTDSRLNRRCMNSDWLVREVSGCPPITRASAHSYVPSRPKIIVWQLIVLGVGTW